MGKYGPLVVHSLVPGAVSGSSGRVAHPVLRTVIVDDEPIARRILQEELSLIPDVSVVGEADNGVAAVHIIQESDPDLVLLDIQMPVCDGFEVLRRLSKLPPAVIFVTAFDQHALRAFEVGAADYLLKPVRQDRLRAAIAKARHNRQHPANSVASVARTLEAATPPGRMRIVGRKGSDFFLLDLDDVLAFRAEGEIVWIITNQRKYLANQTLQDLSKRLEGRRFRRIHRAALINLDHIRKMSALSSQRWLVTMSNDLELIVSKRQAHTIREVIHA
ncbi:MAG: response regulator transcription factor [Acidobacteria bacterium]|nr:response regulator transcription factor [Acidobacteriota bacterium]